MSGNGKKLIGINPSRLTANELFSYVVLLIEGGYKELRDYTYIMEDLLTKGIHQFILDLQRARAWNNRVLGMLQEIRQISSHVSRVCQGKKRLFANAQGTWLRQAKAEGDIPKGLDASERKQLARLACQAYEEEIERWDRLKQEVKDYIDSLKDKQSDLAESKQDLRAQLWAIRIHGVLGEFAAEGKTGNIIRDPDMDSHNIQPPQYETKVKSSDIPPQVDFEIDALLS